MIKTGRGKPVITPEEWIGKEGQGLNTEYDAAILVFWDSPLEILKDSLRDAREVRLRGIPVIRAIEGKTKDSKILVTHVYFGAPAAVISLELLIALGIKTFLVYGGAGSITPELRIGDVLIPTWGIREEGTSYHYMPEEYVPEPSRNLAMKLKEVLLRTLALKGSKVVEGGVWSTDAIFRETDDKIKDYASKGVAGADMESTALMTVAKCRGVELATALIITDELSTLRWRTPTEVEWSKIESDIEKEILNAMLTVLHVNT